ncbi:MAG: SRPBCC family protein [Gemmatimonadaceae bacterium]
MSTSNLSRYFGFQEPVDRRTYLRAGVVLMVVKYIVDVTVIHSVTGIVWTPADYLLPLLSVRATKVQAFPTWLSIGLIVWTLPFIWIGVSMTLRRAVDAGKSPWNSLLFFLPLVNYALMLWLSSLPTAISRRAPRRVEVDPTDRIRSALLGIAASIVIGPLIVAAATLMMRSYGLTLFLATPFVLGGVTAYVHNHGHPRSAGETTGVVMVSLFIVGSTLLLFALEGVVCVLMAAPIAIVAAELGGIVGRYAAIYGSNPPQSAAFLAIILPAGFVADRIAPAPPVYQAVTSIVVNAPPERVWEHVIRFHDIASRPSVLFRLGIAYPIRARITGSGVGAIRRCEFSTGAFVEPISRWDAPHTLSFGVTSQPAALRELSPYRHVYAPHVKGFFKARRGEFRLTSLPGGRTRLEGSTWYSLEIYPNAYWRPFAELIVTQIHRRVLEQVKRESELDFSEYNTVHEQ